MACERCGCEGIHACIGFKPEPFTEDEKQRLQAALDKIKEPDMTPERTRELLENCAKACGIKCWYQYGIQFFGAEHRPILWNPLESSADEAEMEAKLRLDVFWYEHHVKIMCDTAQGVFAERYADHPTPQLARMMAGCRAAEAVYLERGK